MGTTGGLKLRTTFCCAGMALWGMILPLSAQDRPQTVIIDNPGIDLAPETRPLPSLLDLNAGKNNSGNNQFDLSVEEPKIEFVPQETFANRGKALEKKLNTPHKKEEDGGIAYKSDRYLGDFKSGAKSVTINCRDHEFVDGDRVKVYVNDVVVQQDILLDENFYGFTVKLEKGFNKIDFEALNQGSSGPNTAEFQVYDDKGKLVMANRWNLTKGVKATLIIVKE